mgnify:CR=1 FL=1
MSLSKPIPGFQPQDQEVTWETVIDSDFNNLSIFIPYAKLSVTREQVAVAFFRNNIGCVSHVDLIPKENDEGTYYQMFVHFEHWFDNTYSNNIRLQMLSGQQARMVYDDPNYWNMFVNKSTNRNIVKNTKDEITRLRMVIAAQEQEIAKWRQEEENSMLVQPLWTGFEVVGDQFVRPPTPEPAFYNPRSPRTRAPSPTSISDRRLATHELCDNA